MCGFVIIWTLDLFKHKNAAPDVLQLKRTCSIGGHFRRQLEGRLKIVIAGHFGPLNSINYKILRA